MEVFSGNSVSVPVNVIIAGNHVDTDGNLVPAVLMSHPLVVPTVTRLGLGRYLLTFSSLSPSLAAGTITECVVTVTIDETEYTPFGIPLSVIASTPIVSTPVPEPIASDSVGALTLSRDVILRMIAALDVIPNGDPSLPELMSFTVGRKQIDFTGPERRARAMEMLNRQLLAVQSALNSATQAANRGSSFVRLGI